MKTRLIPSTLLALSLILGATTAVQAQHRPQSEAQRNVRVLNEQAAELSRDYRRETTRRPPLFRRASPAEVSLLESMRRFEEQTSRLQRSVDSPRTSPRELQSQFRLVQRQFASLRQDTTRVRVSGSTSMKIRRLDETLSRIERAGFAPSRSHRR